MGKKPNHSALMMVAGLAGLGALLYYSDKRQRLRERNAFDEIDPTRLTQRQVWDKALEFGRKERLDLAGELAEANKIIGRANEMCEVNEGFRKCTIMMADPSVPDPVKESVVKHWTTRFAKTFGVENTAAIDSIFSDEKLVERIGKLAAAQKQYDAWLAEIQEDPGEFEDDLRHCSFCGKSHKEVEHMIAGPSVHICTECVGLCSDILKEKRGRKAEHPRADSHPG